MRDSTFLSISVLLLTSSLLLPLLVSESGSLYMNQLLSRARALNNQIQAALPFKLTPYRSLTSSMAAKEGKITEWVAPGDKSGEFKRPVSQYRNFISRKPGAEFPPEKDRYHLYVSYACPWAHRTLIVRKLKGLEEIIPFTSVHWHMEEKGKQLKVKPSRPDSRLMSIGWRFATSDEKLPGENVTPDPLHPSFTHLRDIYFSANPDYAGRFTVPTLYDKKKKTIVSNESSEIIRMMYTEFDDLLPEKYRNVVLFPENLQQQIELTNDWTYNDINNGVYKSGFATTQDAYERAVTQLFTSLDRVEAHLRSTPGPYYYGEHITEADVRLYTTIIRFDPVYVQHFKCNIRDIRSGYPAIHKWVRNLYWNVAAFKETTQFEHIKKHYTKSHRQINQFSITPVGPVPDILPVGEEVAAVEYVRGRL